MCCQHCRAFVKRSALVLDREIDGSGDQFVGVSRPGTSRDDFEPNLRPHIWERDELDDLRSNGQLFGHA
jgi:hypothetical protein